MFPQAPAGSGRSVPGARSRWRDRRRIPGIRPGIPAEQAPTARTGHHRVRGTTHARPQAPQLLMSLLRFRSHPFASEPSQLPNPALQLAPAHTPAVH